MPLLHKGTHIVLLLMHLLEGESGPPMLRCRTSHYSHRLLSASNAMIPACLATTALPAEVAMIRYKTSSVGKAFVSSDHNPARVARIAKPVVVKGRATRYRGLFTRHQLPRLIDPSEAMTARARETFAFQCEALHVAKLRQVLQCLVLALYTLWPNRTCSILLKMILPRCHRHTDDFARHAPCSPLQNQLQLLLMPLRTTIKPLRSSASCRLMGFKDFRILALLVTIRGRATKKIGRSLLPLFSKHPSP